MLRIVIAEDDVLMLSILSGIFIPPIWNATLVKDGAQAILAVAKTDPHILLTDLHMPVIDGFELVQALRKHIIYADMPIIVLTGAYTRKQLELMELNKCVVYEKGLLDIEAIHDMAQLLAEVRRTKIP